MDSTDMVLVDNIFEFADTTAREIMIPRTEMICLYNNLSLEENLKIASEGCEPVIRFVTKTRIISLALFTLKI